MRARAPGARALLAALTRLGLASRGAGSLSPTLTSEDPMRLDLELNVTRAGDVAVLLWEDTYETGVDGKPMTVVIDLQDGEPNDVSVNTLRRSARTSPPRRSSSPRIGRAPARGKGRGPRWWTRCTARRPRT